LSSGVPDAAFAACADERARYAFAIKDLQAFNKTMSDELKHRLRDASIDLIEGPLRKELVADLMEQRASR
jgi:hypothetical protein